jgi:glycosyltransferase involved in cell wall biosynthesis
VLVPNYNGALYLEECVRSALAQTYRHFEVVTVDDGSHDASLEILRRLEGEHANRIRVLTHPEHVNRGLIETYALALSRARGSIIAFLESDDVWEPDNLARKVQVFERHPEVGVVHAGYRAFGARRGACYWALYGWSTRVTTPADRPYEAIGSLLFRNPIPSFTHFMVRRSLLDEVPPPQGMKRCCDWWALAHLSLLAPFAYVPRKLTRWRIHRGSSHYGPVKPPLRELRDYLECLYDSLLAAPAIARRRGFRAAVERARRLAGQLDPRMLDGRRQVLASLRRHPGLSLLVLADAAARRALFS